MRQIFVNCIKKMKNRQKKGREEVNKKGKMERRKKDLEGKIICDKKGKMERRKEDLKENLVVICDF